jgi:hypothetical protein
MWKKFIEWRAKNHIDNAFVHNLLFVEIPFARDNLGQKRLSSWLS